MQLITNAFFYRPVEDMPVPEIPLMETLQLKGRKFRCRFKVFFHVLINEQAPFFSKFCKKYCYVLFFFFLTFLLRGSLMYLSDLYTDTKHALDDMAAAWKL